MPALFRPPTPPPRRAPSHFTPSPSPAARPSSADPSLPPLSPQAIFKSLIALKTRNALVLSPHPRAVKCTAEAARIVRDAAEKAGAPPGLIQWIEKPTVSLSQALMQSPDIKLILATGGPAMVHAAYTSGHAALGVGSGNTPAIIDASADIQMAVSSIMLSKTFDNGMICASEQSVVVEDSIYEQVRSEFAKRGAHILTQAEVKTAGEKIQVNGKLNVDIVGASVAKLTGILGLSNVPSGTRMFIGEVSEVGHHEPWSTEKLSPILAMYRASDFNAAVTLAAKLVDFAGAGHTSVLYTSPENTAHIRKFQETVNTVRMLINTPVRPRAGVIHSLPSALPSRLCAAPALPELPATPCCCLAAPSPSPLLTAFRPACPSLLFLFLLYRRPRAPSATCSTSTSTRR